MTEDSYDELRSAAIARIKRKKGSSCIGRELVHRGVGVWSRGYPITEREIRREIKRMKKNGDKQDG